MKNLDKLPETISKEEAAEQVRQLKETLEGQYILLLMQADNKLRGEMQKLAKDVGSVMLASAEAMTALSDEVINLRGRVEALEKALGALSKGYA